MSNAGPSSSKYRPSAAASSSSSAAAAAAGGAAQPSEGFTAEMRDRQARGKDPYIKEAEQEEEEEDEDEEMMDEDDEEEEEDEMDVDADDEDEDDDESGGDNGRRMKLGRGPKPEPFEDRERRSFALSVLDNPEQLMMYAQSTGDSIPGQRRRFMAILCGFGTFNDATTQKTTPRRR